MYSPLDELLDISRKWTLLPRGSQVAKEAVNFLRDRCQIDAGFFIYERQPQQDSADYLIRAKRWFSSWGFRVPDRELRKAVQLSTELMGKVKYRQWIEVGDLPQSWRELAEGDAIKQVGIWTITFKREPVGAFVLARRSEGSVDDSRMISRCMAHISVLLEMIITRRVAEELSIRDPLTGTLNRRGLTREFSRMADKGSVICTVVDLDNFKQVNDQQGHSAGDELLAQVGKVLNQHAQAHEGVSARTGGDEFLVLARYEQTDPWLVSETVTNRILELGLSASVGSAVLGVDGGDFDSCYRAADTRLYESKVPASR